MACDVGTLCFFVLSALDLCSASLLASMRACVRACPACPALIQLNSTRAVDASLSVDGDVLQYQMSFLNLTCVDVVDERHWHFREKEISLCKPVSQRDNADHPEIGAEQNVTLSEWRRAGRERNSLSRVFKLDPSIYAVYAVNRHSILAPFDLSTINPPHQSPSSSSLLIRRISFYPLTPSGTPPINYPSPSLPFLQQ